MDTFARIRDGVYRHRCRKCDTKRSVEFRRKNFRYCASCRTARHKKHFQRGDLLSSQCDRCREEDTYKIKSAIADIEYDYRLARFSGKSHFEAIAWLAEGYRVAYKTLRDSIPHFQELPVGWEPDEFVSAGEKYCTGCQRTLDLEDFHMINPKKGNPYRHSLCRDCNRKACYKRFREKEAKTTQRQNRKVRL